MPPSALPEGFRWTWAGDTVRIDLPPFVDVGSHRFEPVLARGYAERVAEAITARWKNASAGSRGKGRPAVARILLARDPAYSAETVTRFRASLSVALVEIGLNPSFDVMDTTEALDFAAEMTLDTPVDPVADPGLERRGPPDSPPPPHAPERGRSGFPTPTWRRRFGKDES